MNYRLQDPQQTIALPELLEDALEAGYARSIAFNRLGTLLAAGVQDGSIVLWDFETRGLARTTATHSAAVVFLAWSKDGRFLASSAADGELVLWNVETDVKVAGVSCEGEPTGLSLSQGNHSLCILSLAKTAPLLVDFSDNSQKALPVPNLDDGKVSKASSTNPADGACATFDKSGSLIFLAFGKGYVAVLSATSRKFLDLTKFPQCSAKAINLSLSKDGKHLLVNYQDKTVRALDVHKRDLPNAKEYTLAALKSAISKQEATGAGSGLQKDGPILSQAGQYLNRVEKRSWQCAAYSCDSEHVAAASGEKDEYKLYLWPRDGGRLERVLEKEQKGEKEGIQTILWHPCQPLLAVVDTSGAVHLWTRVYRENWGAFAPDFRELQENEEYIEPEDIFDINPKPGDDAPAQDADVDVEVDCFTLDPAQRLDRGEEAGVSYFDHLPVEIEPQEFDESGQLVKPAQAENIQPVALEAGSPAASGFHDSEPAVSDVDTDAKLDTNNGQPGGKHRLAVSSGPLADDAQKEVPVKDRPLKVTLHTKKRGRPKKSVEQHLDEEDEFLSS